MLAAVAYLGHPAPKCHISRPCWELQYPCSGLFEVLVSTAPVPPHPHPKQEALIYLFGVGRQHMKYSG